MIDRKPSLHAHPIGMFFLSGFLKFAQHLFLDKQVQTFSVGRLFVSFHASETEETEPQKTIFFFFFLLLKQSVYKKFLIIWNPENINRLICVIMFKIDTNYNKPMRAQQKQNININMTSKQQDLNTREANFPFLKGGIFFMMLIVERQELTWTKIKNYFPPSK